MSIAVFWIDNTFEPSQPKVETFLSSELGPALKFAEDQRKIGFPHVTISTELEDNIGKPGVNSVEDGKTPDGHDYEWSKKQRGDGPRKV